MNIHLLILSYFFGLSLAWNQPNTCQIKQSTCSGQSQDIQEIKESLSTIITMLKQLDCADQTATMGLPSTTTEPLPSVGSQENPATSCSDIHHERPSGEYWIQTENDNSPFQVYCDTNRTTCTCSNTGGWMRVANLDMTDPRQNCPAGFRLVTRTTPPFRTCGRPFRGCVSTTYFTNEVEYSRVCGRVIGYQFGRPEGFESLDINSHYVHGVSLTHGQSPRQHIWTFVNALDEADSVTASLCPCTRPEVNYTGIVPSFVGQDYFCDTGSRMQVGTASIFYPDDPIWDGQGCGGTSTCCEFNNPPWFCKQLPQSTTNDIELRICADFETSDEDTPLERVEIFVQ